MMKDKTMILVTVVMLTCCWRSHSTEIGCNTWKPHAENKDNVCCERCNAGYRIFKSCGPKLEDLCRPCENGTFTLDPSKMSCTKCKRCGGVQVLVAACTRTTDTQCGCPSNLWCNNTECAICVTKCGKGREPESGTCRMCPDGTYNDQEHQKCKPWTSKCTHPGEHLTKGNALMDSSCTAPTTTMKTPTPTTTEEKDTMLIWLLVIAASCVMLLIPFILMIRVVKLKGKKTVKPKNHTQQQPFVTTPTDAPRTLMAIECSFHEPEQVSSSDSLATEESEGSTTKLIV